MRQKEEIVIIEIDLESNEETVHYDKFSEYFDVDNYHHKDKEAREIIFAGFKKTNNLDDDFNAIILIGKTEIDNYFKKKETNRDNE